MIEWWWGGAVQGVLVTTFVRYALAPATAGPWEGDCLAGRFTASEAAGCCWRLDGFKPSVIMAGAG